MKKVLILICCILFLHAGCLNNKKAETLESRVKDLELLVKKYRATVEKSHGLLKKALKISELCFQITESLDRLDNTFYGSKYLEAAKFKNVKQEDVLNGYLKLIARIERDLERLQ